MQLFLMMVLLLHPVIPHSGKTLGSRQREKGIYIIENAARLFFIFITFLPPGSLLSGIFHFIIFFNVFFCISLENSNFYYNCCLSKFHGEFSTELVERMLVQLLYFEKKKIIFLTLAFGVSTFLWIYLLRLINYLNITILFPTVTHNGF